MNTRAAQAFAHYRVEAVKARPAIAAITAFQARSVGERQLEVFVPCA